MSDIIPFGKYQGQEIEQIKKRDPAYLQWLVQQAWFAEKFSPIYQLVVNNFAPPSEDTPAHNAIQVRFLDFDYRAAFWHVSDIVVDRDGLWRSWERRTKQLRSAPRPCDYRRAARKFPDLKFYAKDLAEHRDSVRNLWKGWRYFRNQRSIFETGIYEPTFENEADVQFMVSVQCGYPVHFNPDQPEWLARTEFRLAVEIKPSMGDDYPAVLRQMKRQKAAAESEFEGGPTDWILLVDEFGSMSVTFEQVTKIFARDHIKIVRVSEVREYMTRRQRSR